MRPLWGLAALLAGLVLMVILAAAAGSVAIPPAQVLAALWRPPGSFTGPPPLEVAILWDVRLPRIALALLVGTGLATAGAAFQGLLRNPLADPYLLGVSGGASVGAAAALSLGLQGTLNLAAVPIAAFLGALAAVVLVYTLARGGDGRLSTTALLLAGVAVGAFSMALISYVQTTGDERMQRAIVYWLAGGFSSAAWEQVTMAAPYILLGVLVLLLLARDLDAVLLGEEAALQLGVPVEATKRWIWLAASLVTAATVAVAGLIAFVGLIVPHIMRLLFGPQHRWLLPGSALGGALFLLAADTAGRTLWSPLEVRVSILTGLAGGPFFLWLLRRHLRGEG